MELDLFDYDLPQSMIAQEKSDPRDSSRLFFIDASREPPLHRHLRFRDIIELVEPGDLLILNRSRVIPARVLARKETGGKAEVLLLERRDGLQWEALVGGKNISKGSTLGTGDPDVLIDIDEKLEGGRCEVSFRGPGGKLDNLELMEWLKRWGLMPTPPYIKRFLEDPEEYQTVYGDIEGSVAAPTAGLHFTEELLDEMERRGVKLLYITLHVGLGTFLPVKTERIEDHRMEEEYFNIDESVKVAVREAISEHRNGERTRIWAVGTTVMRTLESAFDMTGECVRDNGKTSLFITPGYEFKLPYKGFITNFHLPRSTPLMLVSAFYDREKVLEAYREAVVSGYRFYSLGDSMVIRRGA